MKPGRSYGDILSSAREPLEFYDDPQIAAISGDSDFYLDELKLENTDVFICAATGDVRETYSGWFRLITMLALDIFEQINTKIETPTLFAIDEMPSLGKIENLAVTAPVMRSYGVRLLIITQDLSLISGVYPDEWTSFFGNADVTYWMATNHTETLNHLSTHLGKAEVTTDSRPWFHQWRIWQRGYKSTRTQELMTPQQLGLVLAPKKENMVVTRFGKKPLRVKTMPYFRELPVAFYDADPDHQETRERAATRRKLKEAAYVQPPPEQTEEVKPEPTPPETEPLQEPVTVRVVEPEASEEAEPVAENVVPIHAAPKATVKLTIVESSALFGISGIYTLDDLEARKAQLLANSEQPESYQRFVEQAYDMLAKPLMYEQARVKR